MSDESIGRVDSFFKNISVAAIELTAKLSVGDTIRIRGTTTDFEIEVMSMQIDGAAVESAGAGDSVGIRVPERVRPNDLVYKV